MHTHTQMVRSNVISLKLLSFPVYTVTGINIDVLLNLSVVQCLILCLNDFSVKNESETIEQL